MRKAQAPRPDPQVALTGLKDFQRKTVEYAFRRLYLDEDKTTHFLLADEVGLGKTLVARGIIARAIDFLWQKKAHINIVYICSNADIARQNVDRLTTGQDSFVHPSRITLLPTEVEGLMRKPINFVCLTPGTSFETARAMGTAEERILLYWLLKSSWRLTGNGPLNILQGNVKHARNFRAWVKASKGNSGMDDSGKIDLQLKEAFLRALEDRIRREQHEQKPDLKTRFRELARNFRYSRVRIPDDERRKRRDIVAELRAVLAASCVKALEPDLIILDEFQRFKNLLEPTEASVKDEYDPARLARELFDYTNPQSLMPTRVLLISATPYKMYTIHDEHEDHYQDLIKTVDFLFDNKSKTFEFEQLISEYRRELLHAGSGEITRLMQLKDKIQQTLRKIMVRTERLALGEDRGGMLIDVSPTDVKLEPHDILGYVALQKLAHVIEQPDTLEYWKSAPYLLNFMDNYQLKTNFTDALGSQQDGRAITSVLSAAERTLLLSRRDIERYRAIDPENARLRALLAGTIHSGLWQLLWLPPSMSYYQLDGPFANSGISRITKRLVFSRWRVVPRVIAALLSYEAERRMTERSVKTPKNTSDARKRRGRLLKFVVSAGRPSGMPALALIYPSLTLALIADPLALRSERGNTALPTKEEMIKLAREKLAPLLARAEKNYAKGSQEDEAWYWHAPFLLDRDQYGKDTKKWFARPELAGIWSAAEEKGGEANPLESRFADHVERARAIMSGSVELGRPPEDLADVLAQMALAAPGVVALRALARVTKGFDTANAATIRDDAACTAHGFISLFNLPEVTTLIRSPDPKDRRPYWKSVLDYCVSGGLQAVLDEYAHVLVDMLGLNGKPPAEAASKISKAIRSALRLHPAVAKVDDIFVRSGQLRSRRDPITMRGRFALRFSDEESENSNEPTRSDQIRQAFNSPFWPFVLATTSIGHEGLDFHSYCHAVWHWNLPSNPVDLEQREGRVNRYKGHAVRKNLAHRYASIALKGGRIDPWGKIFEAGSRDRSPGESDIVPFWMYPVDGGAKIERYVPALPLSRDSEHLRLLKRSLVLYRMVFGQAHQEDLVSFLETVLPQEKIGEYVEKLRIDLSPP